MMGDCSGSKHSIVLAAAVFQLILSCSSAALQAAPCVLKPNGGSGPEVVVILFPAGQMKPLQYLPLAKALQASSSFSLWVGIASFEQDTSQKNAIGDGIASTLSAMRKMGLNQSYSLFVAAHSQFPTGALLQDYLVNNKTLAQKTSGLVLLGSFLKRSYHASSFPIPTLTIGAELDGVCRITRIMEEYVHRFELASNSMQNYGTFPVAVVEGMTHLQFASGAPSDFIMKYDLKPERNDSDVLYNTSCIISNFIAWTVTKSNNSLDFLKAVVQDTRSFLEPLINAYSSEGSYKFKPPCYENPPSPACQIGSLWSKVAMGALADLKTVQLNDVDSFHPADEIFPTYHHPKITSQTCPAPNSSCVVNFTSVTDNIYYKDKEDTGLVPTSACEMRAKLKSRQSVLLAAGFSIVNFNTTDNGSWCKQLNQLAYNKSLGAFASPASKARFAKYGTPMDMGDDLGCMHNGGLWIYLPMKYSWREASDGRSTLVINSIQLSTDVKYPLGIFAGMHYCKLLSPARVAEWVYVDGLRDRYSLSGTRIDMPLCGI